MKRSWLVFHTDGYVDFIHQKEPEYFEHCSSSQVVWYTFKDTGDGIILRERKHADKEEFIEHRIDYAAMVALLQILKAKGELVNMLTDFNLYELKEVEE